MAATTGDRPARRSWVHVPRDCEFTLENLPYGSFRAGTGEQRVGVAIGAHVLDLAEVAAAGLLDGAVAADPEPLFTGNLDELLRRPPAEWSALRGRLVELLAEGNDELRSTGVAERALLPQSKVIMQLPFTVADYVDFYCSQEHASNLGRMFRPGQPPLLPNWRHLPVGYHGRSGTIVESGVPVRRPLGQSRSGDLPPQQGPSNELDYELEMGFVIGGPSTRLGEPVPAAEAADHVFGFVLVNDWSARDIQRWEYVPLGPFLGKSFHTSISAWVVTLDALRPWLVPGPRQDPPVLPYLSVEGSWHIDAELTATLSSAAMRETGHPPMLLTTTNCRNLYWSFPQIVAHQTINGTKLRPGDLYATGTVSGDTPDSVGSLIELSWNGERPMELPTGETRSFLADGDIVSMRGVVRAPDGRLVLGWGALEAEILPSPAGTVAGTSRESLNDHPTHATSI